MRARISVVIDKEKIKGIKDEVLEKVADIFIEHSRVEALRLDAVATGNMIYKFVDKVKSNGKLEIQYNAPYVGFVEFGTQARKKYPPYNAIERWVRIKLHPPKKDVRRITFAIMREIRINGTKPKSFIRNTITKLRSLWR